MKSLKFLLSALILVMTMTSTLSAQKMEKSKDHMKHDDVTKIELVQVEGAFTTESLSLAPGKYQFSVTNSGVNHDLGFVIQKASDQDGDVMKTAVENSFSKNMIANGKTEDTGIVNLTPGEYVYSCPLNPTPKYKLIVK